MKKRITILILLFSLLGILYAQRNETISFSDDTDSTEPIRHLTDGGSTYFEIEYNLPSISISSKSVNGMDYNFIHVEGFGKMGDVGKPALPAHTDIVLFPSDVKPTITILETEVQILDGYFIHPALEPARDTYGTPEPEFEIDNKTYSTDEFYPANPVEVTDIQYFREAPLGFVQITPVQFNPVTKQIKVYTKIKYRVEFNGSSHIFSEIAENNSKNYTNLLKNYVLNNQDIPDGITHTESRDGEKNYIIITHSEYLSQANDLAEWKRQLGYSVEVVSQASWTASQVKTVIQDLYDLWTPHPDYFVIIGDHTGSYAVPGEIHQDPIDNDDFATDLYFACMNGTGDYIPEMAHGRISVSNTAEATTVIQKIINYEKNPTTDASFYSTAINCAYYQDDSSPFTYADRRFAQTSEEIRDYIQGNFSYTINRIYCAASNRTPTYWNNGYYSNGEPIPSELLRSNGYPWDGDEYDISNEINAGRFFVFHRDHGYVGGSGWADPYFTTNEIDWLTNGDELPIVFSINCHTGEFQLTNCFAEKFLRKSGAGAVGVIAAAYYSMSGYNDGFALGCVDAIWSDPGLVANFTGSAHSPGTITSHSDIFTMGDVMNQGLLRMTQTWGNNWGYEQYEYELFHYFGDPAMKIWTANPNTNVITASHVSSLPVGSTSLSITGSNCSDGLATLVFNGELIGEIILSSGSGTITFPALTNDASTAMLTISKHNWKPYTSSITVLDAVPDITVNPLSYSETLGLNETQDRTLSISNDGESGSLLNYSIIIEESAGREITILPKPTYPSADIRIDQIEAVPVKYKSSPNNTDATTLSYHNGFTTALSFGSSGDFHCAARFTSTELSTYYTNNEITQVKIAIYQDHYTDCIIKVWEGGSLGNPGTEVYSQDITASVNLGGWTTHTLTSPISLIAGNEYWVGYSLTSYTSGGASFGSDDGTTPVADKGGWYQYNTNSWAQTGSYNWCIEMVIDENLAELTLTSPNGSEVWANGESQNITWTQSGAALSNVKLELSTNNGTGYSNIIASTLNDGTYEWTVSGTASEQCLVRVSDPAVPTTNDVSNAVFRIYDAVTWLSINQDNGSLGEGSTDNLTLTFDTSELSAGTYNANIQISSNDPDEATVTVPVSLTVSSAPPNSPTNVTISISGSDLTINWDTVAGATSYKVYSSDDPYTGFTEDTSGSFTGESWTTSVINEKKFYHVTAVN